MDILILGGSCFLGRAITEAAMAKGHQVTLFNRGKTNPQAFSELPLLVGDRDGELSALQEGHWDVVVDACGYTPAQVRKTAELLRERTQKYVLVSSVLAYANMVEPGKTEQSALNQLPPGHDEGDYQAALGGALKARAEQVVEEVFGPSRSLLLRPGILIGPHDYSLRFYYWVGRALDGGDLLGPGSAEQPLQLLDVRDLADWLMGALEMELAGPFNLAGPTINFGELLAEIQAATQADFQATWVTPEFLMGNGIPPLSHFPFWVPPPGWGFYQLDCSRALAAGLKTRPLRETSKDVVQRLRQQPQGEPSPLSWDNPLPATREQESQLLAAWRQQNGATA